MKDLKTNGLSPSQLDRALDWAEDTLTRAQIPFLLLGETLRSIRETGQLAGDKIELGIRRRYLTHSTKGMFRLLEPQAEIIDGYIRFEHNGVPIEIKVITKDYYFFRNPNRVFYGVSDYMTPNPWDKYYKARFIIK